MIIAIAELVPCGEILDEATARVITANVAAVRKELRLVENALEGTDRL